MHIALFIDRFDNDICKFTSFEWVWVDRNDKTTRIWCKSDERKEEENNDSSSAMHTHESERERIKLGGGKRWKRKSRFSLIPKKCRTIWDDYI